MKKILSKYSTFSSKVFEFFIFPTFIESVQAFCWYDWNFQVAISSFIAFKVLTKYFKINYIKISFTAQNSINTVIFLKYRKTFWK